MSLREISFFGVIDKVQIAVDRLKAYEPKEGYFLAFSGGKDSVTVKALCDLSGVKYDAHYSVTSVDPPELVEFIKREHPDVSRDIPHDKDGAPVTMWNLIPKSLMPPTRLVRYCCKALKESAGDGRITLTGVHWAESTNRKKNQGIATIYKFASSAEREEFLAAGFLQTDRGGVVLTSDNEEAREIVETCYRRSKTVINPIIDWTDEDVWEFIKEQKISYCGLYDEGYARLGCIGCPMSSNAWKELERYPKYKAAYLRAFGRMLEERKSRGLEVQWKTPEEVMLWWLKWDRSRSDDNQLELNI